MKWNVILATMISEGEIALFKVKLQVATGFIKKEFSSCQSSTFSYELSE